jgi:hypothetical protein
MKRAIGLARVSVQVVDSVVLRVGSKEVVERFELLADAQRFGLDLDGSGRTADFAAGIDAFRHESGVEG